MYARNAQPCQSQSMVKAVLQATRSPACMQRDWASTRVYARTCPLSIRLCVFLARCMHNFHAYRIISNHSTIVKSTVANSRAVTLYQV